MIYLLIEEWDEEYIIITASQDKEKIEEIIAKRDNDRDIIREVELDGYDVPLFKGFEKGIYYVSKINLNTGTIDRSITKKIVYRDPEKIKKIEYKNFYGQPICRIDSPVSHEHGESFLKKGE